jgi:hypothetical protein
MRNGIVSFFKSKSTTTLDKRVIIFIPLTILGPMWERIN